jgi:hypothetical protein
MDVDDTKTAMVALRLDASELLDELKFRKKLPKTVGASEAVKYWVPLVLSGELDVPVQTRREAPGS